MDSSLKLPHLEGLALADPQCMTKGQIELLLDVDVYARIVEGAVKKRGLNEPIAVKSALGWLLSGRTGCLDTSH